MKALYDICGLKVECSFESQTMLQRGKKYLCGEGTPDLRVKVSEAEYEAAARQHPYTAFDTRELILTGSAFYLGLLKFGGFMLHSSAVEVDRKAYLFSAPSGTGKSTHTGQWLKLFGPRARIINDDKPAIRRVNGVLCACGTPWSGKCDISENVCVPIGGICALERSERDYIVRAGDSEAAYRLLDQTIRPESGEDMARLLGLLNDVVREIPVWRMGCGISVQAAKMAYEAMSGGIEPLKEENSFTQC